jgi:hypothetical protein
MSSKIVFGAALALALLLLASTGSAEDAPPLHKGPWPIRNGRNYQPTEHELKALHEEDVTPGQVREIVRSTPGKQCTGSRSAFRTQTLIALLPKPICSDSRKESRRRIRPTGIRQGAPYGTTKSGGDARFGTVFKLIPTATGWAEVVLRRFIGGADPTAAFVEGFGCRPIAAMRLAPWPASESLQ